MLRQGTILEDLTPEKYPWLDETVSKDTVVYQYTGQTFGACSDEGVAVSINPHTTPFFEVPLNLIKWED